MRNIAIALNFSLLIFLGFMLIQEGLPKGKELLFLVFLTIVSVVSIYALWDFRGSGWVSLYFRRKALEEQRKIDELNAHRKS